METIVIKDNNPNLLIGIVLIICLSVIITQLLGISVKMKRRKNLIKVKKKIENRHEQIKEAFIAGENVQVTYPDVIKYTEHTKMKYKLSSALKYIGIVALLGVGVYLLIL